MEFIRSLMNNEGFKQKKEKKEMTTSGIILGLVFCVLFILYLVYVFKFQIECIIYDGQKTDGTIDWGSVVGTFFLFLCCGPCMFVYRLINRCNNDKKSNVGKVNTKTRGNTNVSARPPLPTTTTTSPLQSSTVSQKNNSQMSKSQRQVTNTQ